MNNRIVYGLVAVAFVGGLFSVAYAGPIINTITFEGLTIFKENAQFDKDVNIDGGLTGQTIDGVLARLDALEASPPDQSLCDPNDDLMITPEELSTSLTLRGFPTDVSEAQVVISIAEQQIGNPNGVIDTSAEFIILNIFLSQAGLPECTANFPTPNCNPDNNGEITDEELLAYILNFAPFDLPQTEALIAQIEAAAGTISPDGIINTADELTQLNIIFAQTMFIPPCSFGP